MVFGYLDLQPGGRKESDFHLFLSIVVGGLATEGEQTFRPIGPCQCYPFIRMEYFYNSFALFCKQMTGAIRIVKTVCLFV